MPEKIVLLLNDITHEGLVSALVTAGRHYKQKQLHSGVENWRSIVELFDTYKVVAVLGKMNGTTYDYLVDSRFESVRGELFGRITKIPNRIFVFEDLLNGTGDPHGQYSESYREVLGEVGDKSRSELLTKGNAILRDSGLDIFPYRKRAEVTISSQAFLEEIEEGLLFRLYVPAGRLWESEIGRLLGLFKDYLAKVAGISVRLDQTSTNKGVIYAFHSQTPQHDGQDLAVHFEQFSRIADLCVVDPIAAERLIGASNSNLREVAQIVAKYSKEMRRLQIDLKHAREEKVLSIRHRLESELLECETALDQGLVEKLVDSLVPNVLSSFTPQQLLPSPTAESARNLTVNINPQFFSKVTGIVAQEVSGHVHLNSEDQQLIELFQKYGEEKTTELTSSLHELNDDSAPESGRVTAKQRIKRFLIGCSEKAGELAVGVMQTYIERKLFGG